MTLYPIFSSILRGESCSLDTDRTPAIRTTTRHPNTRLVPVVHVTGLHQQDSGVVGWAEHLVVTQSPGAKVSAVIAQSGLPVLDLVGGMAGGVAVPVVS